MIILLCRNHLSRISVLNRFSIQQSSRPQVKALKFDNPIDSYSKVTVVTTHACRSIHSTKCVRLVRK